MATPTTIPVEAVTTQTTPNPNPSCAGGPGCDGASPASVPCRKEATTKIIRRSLYWTMGLGLVPIPVVDILAIGGFQLKMISELSEVYGIKFSESTAKSIIAALIGGIGASALGRVLAVSLVKAIPGVGGILGGVVATPAVAGGLTYAIAKVFIQHFEAGGTFLDFNPEKTRAYFASMFQEGKKVASDLQVETKPA